MREYKLNLYGKEIIVNQDTDGYFIKPDFINEYEKYGTATKPAYEPIIVARKPFKTSVAENIMQYGVGGINVDECRVGNEDTRSKASLTAMGQTSGWNNHNNREVVAGSENGRFPSNVIHDGSEEAIKDMPNTSSSNGTFNKNDYVENETATNFTRGDFIGRGDSGSASRYFYCAKASKKDRDEGLDMFDKMQVNDGRKTSIDNAYQRGDTLRKNIHPTVKPVELMQYLVRLVTPKNGIILDCFCGSGSTGKATMFENRERNVNYKFIGIELTEEYLPICEARIDYALNKYEYDFKKELEEAKERGQSNIFDLIGE